MSSERLPLDPQRAELLRRSPQALSEYVLSLARAGGIPVSEATADSYPNEVDVTLWVTRDPGTRGWSWASTVSSELQGAGVPASVIFRELSERLPEKRGAGAS